MALTPLLQTVAGNWAQDTIACIKILRAIQDAAEHGPWRYSPEDIAEMWEEMTYLAEQVRDRRVSLQATYDPWVVFEVADAALDIINRGLS